MPRVIKNRRVCAEPTHTIFKVGCQKGECMILQVEELESLRLADFEGLDQEAAAKRMSVSRGTFQRILYVARHKVSEALVTGKSIVIEGGNYQVSDQKCSNQKVCKCCRFKMNVKGDGINE